jgi:NAD-dependent SIR2 family protein deacetylase
MASITECSRCGKVIEDDDSYYDEQTAEPTCDSCKKLIKEGKEDEIE